MRENFLRAIVVLAITVSTCAFGSTSVKPTTTLAAQTGNNTSTADGFQASINGNAAAGNVSKVDTRALLYPGSTTRIYAHYLPWFGQASHINVGYSADDANQANRTVDDMASRGIQGVIVDWYGQNFSFEDQGTELMLRAAERHSGFQFAVMIDAGGIKGNPTSGVVSELIYAWQKYMQSGSYIRFNGRPVVFYFGVESLPVDWNYVRSNVPGNPLFIFENANLFGQSFADGAFSWVGDFGNPGDWGQAYLDNFYAAGQATGKHTVGSVKKGFNSTGAAWGANRVINQNCGQTWLNTFADIGRHYSSGRQLESLQLVTWNDYEEGTAIETGIDNCVSISGSASGSSLSWNISGNENTINHYTVYISSDGENLMPVADVPAGTHSLNLSQFGFSKGAYTVYVQAVGQPSIRNHMSGPIGYSSDGSSSGVTTALSSGASLSLSATPSKVTVAQGGSASTTVTVTPSGNFDSTVNLGCANLAAGLSCSFTQSSVMPGSKAVTTTLTVSANSGTQTASLRHGFGLGTQLAIWFPGLGVGMVFFSNRKRSRKALIALGVVAVAAIMIATGCGGGGKNSNSPLSFSNSAPGASSPGTYQITILAQSGSMQRTTTATVTVQ